MLLVAVAAWAECKITSETKSRWDSSTSQSISYTSCTIAIDAPGDLAKAFDTGSEVDVSSLKTATDFKFTGTLNSKDIEAITAKNFGGTQPSGDVYFDFSGAELDEGTDFTELKNSTVKYIVLPDGTEEIDMNALPNVPNVQEMLAVNGTEKIVLLYAAEKSDGRVNHLLDYTDKWKQPTLTEMTLKLYGTFKDVFGQMSKIVYGNTSSLFKPTVIDLRAASFPTFTADDKFVKDTPTLTLVNGDTYKAGGSIGAWMGTSTGDVTGKANGLAELNFFKNSVETIFLPTDANTTLLPMQSCSGMNQLKGEFVIPANIKTIGAIALEGITSETVTIKAATEIGRAAFANATKLKDISLPQGLKTVEPFLFSGCTELDNVELPEGVTRIEEFAFGTSGDTNGLQLHAIRLPNTLEYIGKEAFRLNRFLKTLTIPDKVQTIESNAFGLCTSLTDVYFLGKETIPVVAYNAFDGETYYGNNSDSGNGANNAVSQSTTFTKGEGENAKVMAILHYPIVEKDGEEDFYGKYYTDLERNAKYTGIPSSYDKTTGEYEPLDVDYKWPIGAKEYKYDSSGTGNYANDEQAGLKNFQLVAGWKEDGSTYTPSTPAPRLDRNIWYTFCVPANLSKQVIREAFGGDTQVCRFLGMRKKADGSNSFVIDFSVDMMTETKKLDDGTEVDKYGDNDIVMESCVPYMIHPSTQPVVDGGGFVSPIDYFITGSTGYEYVKGMKAKGYYGDYDPNYGEYSKTNTDACKNYLSGYKFVGNIDQQMRTDFCYYFGNVWYKDKDGNDLTTKYPKKQAFWSYEGEDTEGWELTLSVCSGYIIYDNDASYEGGASAPAGAKPAMVEMNFGVSYDDMEPTGIQEIEDGGTGAEADGGSCDTQVYNLSGQYVGKDLRGLPKGIYIKGGKKYVIK